MNTIVERVHEQKPKLEGSSLWRRIKTVLLLLSFLGLLSANIATLVSDSLHTAAFNTLKSVLGYTFADTVLTRILSQSPTVKRNELVEKHAKLKTESTRKAETVHKASKRIATRSVVGATRNITSLAGQAIPLIGTTLIIGVTAWDIHDFCQNIKDINELSDVFEHQLEDQDTVCGMEVPTKEQVMANVRENWQDAYKDAKYQINLSHKNAKVLITQKYEDAKAQAILTENDLEDQLEETYRGAVNKINQINTRIEIPPLTEIWETGIKRIYDLFGKFAQ